MHVLNIKMGSEYLPTQAIGSEFYQIRQVSLGLLVGSISSIVRETGGGFKKASFIDLFLAESGTICFSLVSIWHYYNFVKNLSTLVGQKVF